MKSLKETFAEVMVIMWLVASLKSNGVQVQVYGGPASDVLHAILQTAKIFQMISTYADRFTSFVATNPLRSEASTGLSELVQTPR